MNNRQYFLSDGIELNLTKRLNDMEFELNTAESRLYSDMRAGFSSFSKAVSEFTVVLLNDILKPASEDYASSPTPETKRFIRRIVDTANDYSNSVVKAEKLFVNAFGQKYVDKNYSFYSLKIPLSMTLLNAGIYYDIYPEYKGLKIQMSGFFLAPLAIATIKSVALDAVINKALEIRIVRDMIANLVGSFVELYGKLLYSGEQGRSELLKDRSENLSRQAEYVSQAFDTLINSFTSLQENILKETEKLSAASAVSPDMGTKAVVQAVTPSEKKAPYRLVSVTKKKIEVGEKGAGIEARYERVWNGLEGAGAVEINPINLAVRILSKEFSYG